jgi:hypothetical protein
MASLRIRNGSGTDRFNQARGQGYQRNSGSLHTIWFLFKILLLVVEILVFLALVTTSWWLSSVGYWLHTPTHIRPADVIVVHGGSQERFPYGIELYHQGLGSELWIAGLQTDAYTDTVRAARDMAIASGIPPDSIYLLAATSTWEDGREIAGLARERKKTHLLVVTSWWHSRRALCNDYHHLRGSGVAVSFAAPPPYIARPDNWWRSRYGQERVLSELGKTAFYWFAYGLNPWTC